ncbi:MAG: V-type ATP synthase subunit I [Phycisphaerae bacterium]|nr:V-type ATP synthase subunit I [Phycisphaerae bacterium]
MSIARMQKVLIASYSTEAADVLEALQSSGMMQIHDAERAIVSKEWPELHTEKEKPKQIEELSAKIDAAVEFLAQYAPKRSLTQALAPRAVVSEENYTSTVRGDAAMKMLEQCTELSGKLAKQRDSQEQLNSQLAMLLPWQELDINLSDLENFEKGAVILGLIPTKNFIAAQEKIKEFKAAIETAGKKDGHISCVVIGLKENAAEIYKALRSVEFEAVNLSQFKGTPAELIKNAQKQLDETQQRIAELQEQARQMSKDRLQIGMLADYYKNLLGREQTRLAVPETEQTVLFEGWVKKHDLKKIKNILSGFSGTSISLISPAEDEEIPVHIENSRILKPFEVITRMYGMPQYVEVDPTILLAPFFAIFFALCLGDAGAGLILIAISAFFIKKLQGDKSLLYLLAICGVLTIGTGAMTGGWFGSGLREVAIAHNIKWLSGFIDRTMWFDPLKDPMKFFAIAVGLGYFQIMLGLLIGFIDCMRRKEYAAAVFDKLVWLLLINSFALFGAAKMGHIPAAIGSGAIKFAILPAVGILLFSQREGGWGGRIGMGSYQLFSSVFYLGYILSYLRLMALGISSAGVAMAINEIAKTATKLPYVGLVVAGVILVFGHIFLTTASSALGSFVHTMRLQFVEYFPKFLVGGGKEFAPLSKQYKYVYIKDDHQSSKK